LLSELEEKSVANTHEKSAWVEANLLILWQELPHWLSQTPHNTKPRARNSELQLPSLQNEHSPTGFGRSQRLDARQSSIEADEES
jgi:hypothetical protein